MIKKIVIPIDLSDNTEYIIRKALECFHQNEFEIILLHITSADVGFIIGEIGFQYLHDLKENTLKNETDQLKKISDSLSKKNIKHRSILLQGNPSDEILKFSKEEKVHLIIMGSHGRSSFYDAFIGSISKSVLKQTKIPVLLIPIVEEK